MTLNTKFLPVLLSAMAATPIMISGCVSQPQEDVLVQVGTTVLTTQDLQKALPYGISGTDSIAFTKAYIHNWIDDQLITNIASANIPNSAEIDKMVEDYRKQLIIWEYRRRRAQQESATVLPDSIAAYYERNSESMHTTTPFIKGIYIKLPNDAPQLKNARKWIKSARQEDIDRLERGLNGAVHYDYFRDRWVEWTNIESVIPYNFGSNPDNFIRDHKTLDVEIDGFIYLLNITDYLPSGSTMTLEMAEPYIRERMEIDHRQQSDRQLIDELYRNAIESGKLKIYISDF